MELSQTEVEWRIFVDKYLVEVFVCNCQAVLGTYANYRAANGLLAHSYGSDTTFRTIEIWNLKATNQGFFKARQDPIWQPGI